MHVVICDDHPTFRSGLGLVVASLFQESEVSEVASLGALQELLGQLVEPVELILLDLALGDGDSLGLIKSLTPRAAKGIVVISASTERAKILEALEEGARGFIPKTTPLDVLTQALRLVLAGGVYIPHQALRDAEPEPAAPPAPSTPNPEEVLTPRQREIAELVSRGLTNQDICGVLGISENTVKAHLKALFRALSVTNRTEVAMIWLQRGG